ncbi:hypothetical protein [Sphingobacterium chuzhouense]|uniref:Lipid A core - O-antigen ligase and related enzymes n=1 Tax=Sphingobacterium chuzhouense TaxID=1742264 RepID=A0ABR7XTN1_9SPHI|nr:hypothetical protein [Sphingobacterium chuzhouense]MBD1422496.1 hypothetical protein [Sphingobacterium chuzhouense]
MKTVLIILAGIVTSFFYFPFEFTFLPVGLNTKIMMAVVGLLLIAYHIIKMGVARFSREIIIASLIAVLFSLTGLLSMDYNNSNDSAYASYIISMWVWLAASYTVVTFIAVIHQKLNFRLVVDYLVVVCLSQCVLALVIDFVPAVKVFVDRYIDLGINEFLTEVNRLYGMGAALDVAGIRFSAVLVMMSILLVKDEKLRENQKELFLYAIAFLVIGGIGNMISRTTTVGLTLSLGYLVFFANVIQANIKVSNLQLWKIILLAVLIIATISVYFYNTNAEVYKLLRFAFEGFFNWIETGEWRTDSTDRLNNVMWIWPDADDYETWIIGKATFSNWHAVGTDIGYCRFIFYSGLIGLSIFTFFFMYLSYALWRKFPVFKHLFLLLFVLALINWLKVATDIFLVYALFLSVGSPYLYHKYYVEEE